MQGAGKRMLAGPSMTPAPPQTRGTTVLGWLLVCFSVAPLTMGASGDGALIGWAGVAMVTAGLALVAIGRKSRDINPR
jgi:hypothetical protein